MILEGTVTQGVVVFAGNQSLPEGTRVEIRPIEGGESGKSSLGERLSWLTGSIQEMPADFSEEHNHYIHGAPRRRAPGDA